MLKPHHSKKAIRATSYALIALTGFVLALIVLRAHQETAYLEEAAKGYLVP